MKKISAIVLAVLLLIWAHACAEEILFRDIPWGSSLDYVEEVFDEGGFYSAHDEAYVPYWESYKHQTDILFGSTQYPVGWVGYYSFYGELDVGGYSVEDVQVWYSYGIDDDIALKSKQDSEMYAATYVFGVVDVKGAYEDIKQKMSALYGECVEECVADGGIMYAGEESTQYDTVEMIATWHGDESTEARLVMSASNLGTEDYLHNYLMLHYGKSNHDKQLEQLVKVIEWDMILQEEENRNSDTNGL